MENHILIIGFGLPGRFIAESLDFHGTPYCVIELNPITAAQCNSAPIIVGDARQEATLKQAGIDSARMLAITVPSESVAHEIIAAARAIRGDLYIIARVNYISAGYKAQLLGADQAVVGEQLIAREFFRRVEEHLGVPPQSKPLRL